MTFFPTKSEEAVVVCNACIIENKNKPRKALLANAQKSGSSPEAMILLLSCERRSTLSLKAFQATAPESMLLAVG